MKPIELEPGVADESRFPMPRPDFERLYTVLEIAELLGVTKLCIRWRLKKGIMKGRKIGKRWYITESELKDHIKGD